MKSLTLSFLVLLTCNLFAQGHKTIDLSNGLNAKHSISYSRTDEVLLLDNLPETLTLLLNQSFWPYVEIQLNSGSDSTILRSNCITDLNCLSILSDLKDDDLLLRFDSTQLIGIGSETLPKPIKMNLKEKKPYIKIRFLNTSITSPCGNIPIESEPIGPVSAKLAERYRNIFICSTIDTLYRDNCAIEIPSNHNFAFLPPCHSSNGVALTASYHVIYDMRRIPESITYLELNKKEDERYNNLKKCKACNKSKPGNSDTTDDKSGNGDTSEDKTKKTCLCAKNKDRLKYFEHYNVLKGPLRPRANTEMIVSIIGHKDTNYVISTESAQHFMEHQADFEGAVSPASQNEANEEQETAIALLVDSLMINQEVKAKLSSLQADLSIFNSMYPTIDLIEKQYREELRCIQQNISKHFSIPFPLSGDQLESDLSHHLMVQNIDRKYLHELCLIIQDIKFNFENAIAKQVNYYISSESVKVEDADEFTIKVQTDTKVPVFERKFNVRGGFKIDFSTGLFFTGHNSGDFVISSETLRYKNTEQFVLPSGKDTLIYTGEILDTSLTVIRQNKSLTFGTGAYMHFYKRTGKWIDYGGSAGIIINNNAQVQILLGGSLMLKAGKNRIAFVGGMATGKEKTLSTENSQYFMEDYSGLLNSRNEIPNAYTGTNPATYDKWKLSWFAGVTFNFSSKSPGGK